MDKQNAYRVVSFLTREELDFLDELEKDIYFSQGIHIPRAKLIEEIIAAFSEDSHEKKETVEQELINDFKEEEEENEK